MPEEDSARGRFGKMYHEIRMRICLLDYPPGTRLSEEAMAREFGVSRTPLRRVLGRLEAEGLLQSVHGVGTLVTDVEIEELIQVYRLRTELAELAGLLDPVPPDAKLIASLDGLVARAKALVARPDPRGFAQLNIDFFEAHMALTANEPLREISRRLYYQTHRIWLKSVTSRRIDLVEEVQVFDREVEDYVRALRIGDLEAAAHVHRAHISMSFTRMRKNAA
ncbi:GntR family transcriptional regulator [Solirhodobacter olei]|uniref:GntR family transcriptional regulator n=1 Tax=Solirhodobacter olei TaxID=2493082 RepID=UPI000FDB144C|nr:GntR family transcriptional regulator [Solirhodobacter olei]